MTPQTVLELIRASKAQLHIFYGKFHVSFMDDNFDSLKFDEACYAVVKLPRKWADIKDLVLSGY